MTLTKLTSRATIFLKFNSDQDDIYSPNFVFEPVAPVKIDY